MNSENRRSGGNFVISPEEIENNLNEIFKQVVVNRDWKSHQNEIIQIYNSDDENRKNTVDALRSIMLKIMVIPQA